MEFLHQLVDLVKSAFDVFLHVDQHLQRLIESLGGWIYGLLFLVVFCETGLVVTPFLPGDSLLFAVGAFAALGSLDLWGTIALLTVAAILGDTVNYAAGYALGPRLARDGKLRFIKKEHLEKTHAFYEKYGGKTIILARFVPIVRTFAPFVAGLGSMSYRTFMTYNVVGAAAWVVLCTLAGYFFGNLPFVKKHFELVLLAIIGVSLLPAVVEVLRERARLKRDRREQ
jgi:membrane-associated protein